MGFAALCYQELLRPSGAFDAEASEEMANTAAFELACAINLLIQAHTKR